MSRLPDMFDLLSRLQPGLCLGVQFALGHAIATWDMADPIPPLIMLMISLNENGIFFLLISLYQLFLLRFKPCLGKQFY